MTRLRTLASVELAGREETKRDVYDTNISRCTLVTTSETHNSFVIWRLQALRLRMLPHYFLRHRVVHAVVSVLQFLI